MQYLGRVAGEGVLLLNGDPVAPVSYDLEGFLGARSAVTGSGEIVVPPIALNSILGTRGLQLRTSAGRLLDLRFSEKEINRATGVVQVEASGDLPRTPSEWRERAILEPSLAALEA
jgi:hypothetical protein